MHFKTEKFRLAYKAKFLVMNRGNFIPRSANLKSRTGYHHIILKGINPSNLFESDQDKAFFCIPSPIFQSHQD